MRGMLKFMLAVCLGLQLLGAQPVSAQGGVNGSLQGRITDQTAAAVEGASVTLVKVDTGARLSTVTDEGGLYRFPRLVPGLYALSVERAGFRRAAREGVSVEVNEAVTADLVLAVGEVSETVTVASGATSVQTQSVELSALVDGRRSRELPLNGKNFQQLILLAPGVGGVTYPNNPNISGARSSHNTYSIDGGGASDERTAQGIANYGGAAGLTDSAPSLVSTEAIQEFRVITSNADATFGRASGGQINIITKSGTNELHGSLYEYLRNDALDARDFFNDGPFFDSEGRAKVPPFKQHLFGGTVGGPVFLPRFGEGGAGLYDGRDLHFFFASYEAFRQRRQLQTATTAFVPNAALINLIPGDLGRLYRAFYVERGIVPATGNPAGEFSPLPETERAAALQPGAGFDPSLFDGDHANGEAGTVQVNTAPTANVDQNALLVRTDHRLSARLTASFRYALNQPNQISEPDTGFPADLQQTRQRWQSGVAQFVYTLTPAQILEVRAGVQRNKFNNGPLGGTDPRLVAVGVSPDAGLSITPSGTGLTEAFVYQGSGFLDNQTIPQASLLHTATRGRLTLRSGLDLRFIQANVANYSASVPSYTFSGFVGPNGLLGSRAAQPQAVAVSANIGSVFGADGGPTTALRGWRSRQQEYFTQADWRVRPDLTLNLGLRYSYFGVYSEVNEAISNLYAVDASGNVRDDVSPFAFGPAANRIATLAEQPLYQPDRDNLQPRLGVAWDIGGRGRTVLRAGYGLYYDRIYQNAFTSNITNPPFATSGAGADVEFRLGGVVPAGATAINFTAVDPSIRNPQTHRFNLALERKFGEATSVSVAYAGARGRELLRQTQPNGGAGVPQALRPNPGLGFVRLLTNAALSDYNALQVFGRRRLSRGIDFTVAYTFGRSRDNVSFDPVTRPSLVNLGANPLAGGVQGGGAQFVERPLRADFGNSDFDVRHNLTITHLIDLPFGRGRRYLSDAGGLLDVLVGGFSLAGIAVLRSGEPVNLIYGSDINDDGDTNHDRPALFSGSLDGLYAGGRFGPLQYLIPRQEAQARLGLPDPIGDPFAAIPRNALRSPSVKYYDLSLIKRVPLGERAGLSFEVNAFNVFNHVNFGPPVAARNNARFGQITSTRAGTNPRQLQLGLKLTF